MVMASELIERLQLAIEMSGDRPVYVKGDHSIFVKAYEVWESIIDADEVENYYVDLKHIDDANSDDLKIFTIEG